MNVEPQAPTVFAPEPDYTGKRPRDFTAFEAALADFDRAAELDALLENATLPDLQALMAAGRLTSETLVLYYVDRIRRYDVDQLNSIMELNPQALTLAREADAARANGDVRGALHGIPVLLKDNICTGDGMHCTAGAAALADLRAPRDAFLVARLREAGAVILGKTNLSEWANWMNQGMPNGFSTLGGQTRTPYGAFDPSGSSSGSAVAVAANFAAVSIGTETSGSIISPASVNAIVGLKPSWGLVSRDGIIPLAEPMDTAGPMARTVTDAAILFNALVGVDARDPATTAAAEVAGTDFTRYLDADAAQGMRIGVVMLGTEPPEAFREFYQTEEALDSYRAYAEALNARQRDMIPYLEAAGLQPVVLADATAQLATANYILVLEYGFREGLNAFLRDLGDAAPIQSLEAIIEYNAADLANRAPYGQGTLIRSQDTSLTAEAFEQIVRDNRAKTGGSLRDVMQQHHLDALLTVNNSASMYYAPAGFPALTIPAGYTEEGQPNGTPFGTPFGATFVGDTLTDGKLFTIGFAFERVHPARRPPTLEG